MTFVMANMVFETSTTQGTGTIDLDGAQDGFQTFVAGVGDGNTCSYVISDGTDWEIGIGTVTDATPDTLSRSTVLASSNSGAAVNWGPGTRNVRLALPAEIAVTTKGDYTLEGAITFSGTVSLPSGSVDTAQLATDAVETAKIADGNVTLSKIVNTSSMKVLGNLTGTAAPPAEVSVLDEDDMSSNSATALATQQSIKAYVDNATSTWAKSGEMAITLGSQHTFAHGLSSAPNHVHAYLVCKTADLGYSVGDYANMQYVEAAAGGFGAALAADGTNITFTPSSSGIRICRKDTGAHANITVANWKVVLMGQVIT